MPNFYTFYAADGTAMRLAAVDDVVREALGLPADPNKWSDEFEAFTWWACLSNSLDDLRQRVVQSGGTAASDAGNTPALRIVDVMLSRGMSLKTGYVCSSGAE